MVCLEEHLRCVLFLLLLFLITYTHTVDAPSSSVVKCLCEVILWGSGVLFLPCVCVGVGGVVLCRCVCVCVCDLLIFLSHTLTPHKQSAERYEAGAEAPVDQRPEVASRDEKKPSTAGIGRFFFSQDIKNHRWAPSVVDL